MVSDTRPRSAIPDGYFFIHLALSVPCVKMRDGRITKASEAFIVTLEIPKAKHHKSLSIFQIFKSFNILTIVIVTIMAEKISKKNLVENPTEVSLKTPSDFQGPSNRQKLQSSTEFNGSTISACFSNILEKFTIKQADIMRSFAEVFANNKTKNINKISNETGKKLETFNDSLIAHKAKGSTGVATISINPNKTKPLFQSYGGGYN